MAGGNFTHGQFHFRVEGADYLPGVGEPLDDDAFDLRLTPSGRVPDLGGAPLASWLLARLARLTDDGFPSNGKEHNDGGGWCVEFVVYGADERPLAAFQFQGDMQGAAVVGDRAPDCDPEAVLGTLAEALLEHPGDLLRCRLRVVDPEWKHDPGCYEPRPVPGDRNVYGWDGQRYLGRKNIREARRAEPGVAPDRDGT
jgi:hypothetical protein